MGIIKHNGEKEQSFVVGGFNLSLNKVIGIGYANYKDVFYEDLRGLTTPIYNSDGTTTTTTTYQDNDTAITDIELNIETFIMTLKFRNLAFDHLTIKTTFDDDNIDPTYLKIFNRSLFYRKWIFTYGMREEESFREAYDMGKTLKRKSLNMMVFLGFSTLLIKV